MSEFAETLPENMKLLQDDNLKVIHSSIFTEMAEQIPPTLDSLSRLNTKSKDVSHKEDTKTVLSFLYNNDQPLDKAVEEMFLVGGALFSTAIQYLVARSILSDPKTFAEKVVLENEASKEFKKAKHVKALRQLLQTECRGDSSHLSTSTGSTSNVRRALLHELEDSDDDVTVEPVKWA